MSPPRNRILRALSADQLTRILSAAQLVELPTRRILYDVNEPVSHVYFPETGIASIVTPLKDGSAVETSMCANEGMVGLPLYLHADTAPNQAFQQIAGTAWQLDRETFLNELERGSDLRREIGRFAQATIVFMSQTSACNRRHSIEERCIRWLLFVDDVVEGPAELTQQFLSQMLGVRRASVTVIAGALQQAKLIEYHRGKVSIMNRPGMLDLACECYALIRNEYAKLLRDGTPVPDPRPALVPSDGNFSALGDGA
jgi:CRP-like cAMP-binding protein